MVKKTYKKEETLNLETILFKCKDILRQAKNYGLFFVKRDITFTSVFLRFLKEKYEDGVISLLKKLIEEGLDPDNEDIQKTFFGDPAFVDGLFNSSKSNRIPDLDYYLPKMARVQHRALRLYTPQSRKRDNLLDECYALGLFPPVLDANVKLRGNQYSTVACISFQDTRAMRPNPRGGVRSVVPGKQKY